MPVASYRSTFGVAKDVVNTTLASAVASGATTVVLTSASGITQSTWTVTIIDGPNTEQLVPSVISTNTLTVPATAHAHSAGAYVIAQATASLGPAAYIPLTVLEVNDNIMQLPDKGMRGSAVEDYGSQQGMRWAEISVGGNIYPDTFPWFAANICGSTDFTSGTPNTHAFAVNNTGTSQATPLCIWDFNAIDTRVYSHCRVSDLAVKFDPSGLLTYTAKITGYISGPVAATTPSFSTEPPSPAWLTVASFAGSAVSYVLSADVEVKRAVTPVDTLRGIQDPDEFWQGAQSADGKISCVMNDNTVLNYFENNTQPTFDLTFTATGSNPHVVEFHFTVANLTKATPKQTGTRAGYVELDAAFTGEANTTDATTSGTGYAPVKITVKNAVATGTYL